MQQSHHDGPCVPVELPLARRAAVVQQQQQQQRSCLDVLQVVLFFFLGRPHWLLLLLLRWGMTHLNAKQMVGRLLGDDNDG